MKKIFLIALSLILSFVMVACSSNEIETAPGDKTGVLYTVFSLETGEELIQEHEFTYSGDLTPEIIADGLTYLTGYNFSIEDLPQEGETTANIKWKTDSSFVTAVDGTIEPKEGFLIMEIDSIRWFMLDSLYMSITKNTEVEEVYYTYEGDKNELLENTPVLNAFMENEFYLGSYYYTNTVHKGALSFDEASTIVFDLLGSEAEGKTLLEDDVEEINGEECKVVILGTDTPEKFSAEKHFAVSPDGVVYILDIIAGGEWVEYIS